VQTTPIVNTSADAVNDDQKDEVAVVVKTEKAKPTKIVNTSTDAVDDDQKDEVAVVAKAVKVKPTKIVNTSTDAVDDDQVEQELDITGMNSVQIAKALSVSLDGSNPDVLADKKIDITGMNSVQIAKALGVSLDGFSPDVKAIAALKEAKEITETETTSLDSIEISDLISEIDSISKNLDTLVDQTNEDEKDILAAKLKESLTELAEMKTSLTKKEEQMQASDIAHQEKLNQQKDYYQSLIVQKNNIACQQRNEIEDMKKMLSQQFNYMNQATYQLRLMTDMMSRMSSPDPFYMPRLDRGFLNSAYYGNGYGQQSYNNIHSMDRYTRPGAGMPSVTNNYYGHTEPQAPYRQPSYSPQYRAGNQGYEYFNPNYQMQPQMNGQMNNQQIPPYAHNFGAKFLPQMSNGPRNFSQMDAQSSAGFNSLRLGASPAGYTAPYMGGNH
ncbi:MAG: hypothetical protein HON90_14325, partial [Halobacteriovoraceae bacterium]|nr:hypothetical protein [Halobacteriovoraceae bacterium]